MQQRWCSGGRKSAPYFKISVISQSCLARCAACLLALIVTIFPMLATSTPEAKKQIEWFEEGFINDNSRFVFPFQVGVHRASPSVDSTVASRDTGGSQHAVGPGLCSGRFCIQGLAANSEHVALNAGPAKNIAGLDEAPCLDETYETYITYIPVRIHSTVTVPQPENTARSLLSNV